MNHAESFFMPHHRFTQKIPACKKAFRYIHAPPPSPKSHEHHKPANIKPANIKPANIKPANIIALNITFKKIDNTLNLLHIHEKIATSQQEPLN
jgi:hypothetical protein